MTACAEGGASLQLGTTHFKEANERVRRALQEHDAVRLDQVFAQRYLGCAMQAGKRLEIHGVPGNDMACYLDGGAVEVFGNAQDQVGNTMNDGLVVVHGRCGDAAGYSMRGGRIFIRDDCGWRVGIHMKQYEGKRPAIVIGGDAGCFLGEYIAGGVIVLMGRPGDHIATGMHGGIIFTAEPVPADRLPEDVACRPIDEAGVAQLAPLLEEFRALFSGEDLPACSASPEGFFMLEPASSRPYENRYVK